MVVRDLFNGTDEVRVIARAIFEDHFKRSKTDEWITKYYAQLVKLRDSKIRKSDMMLYFSVIKEAGQQYGSIGGFRYKDIKAGRVHFYALETLNYRKYAGLYVPEYTVQRYGVEAVAAEVLREYGWNGFDETIVCPEAVRKQIWDTLDNMTTGLFLVDIKYFERCRKQFCTWYEGKTVPLWEGAEHDPGVVDNRGSAGHEFIF